MVFNFFLTTRQSLLLIIVSTTKNEHVQKRCLVINKRMLPFYRNSFYLDLFLGKLRSEDCYSEFKCFVRSLTSCLFLYFLGVYTTFSKKSITPSFSKCLHSVKQTRLSVVFQMFNLINFTIDCIKHF